MSDVPEESAEMPDVEPSAQMPQQSSQMFSLLDDTFQVGTCSSGLTQPRTLDMLDEDLVKEGEEGLDDGIEGEFDGGFDEELEDRGMELEGIGKEKNLEREDVQNEGLEVEISAGQGNMDSLDTLNEDTVPDTLDTLDTAPDTGDTLDTLDPEENIAPGEEDKENRRSRIIQMPLSRIKAIMKMDPEVKLVNQDAAIMVARATELFLQTFTTAAARQAVMGKRKTIQKKDLEYCVNNYPYLEFLEDIPL